MTADGNGTFMEKNLKADKLINALRDIEEESRLSIASWIRKQIENGISESDILDAVQKISSENQTTIEEKIETLLVEGVIDAYFLLDYAKARSEFLRAARLKDSSMSVLGYLFLSDLYENNLFQNEMHSPDENKRISSYYSAVAAVMGSTAGQRRLGDHYRDGYSVPKDSENAIKWYRTAAEGQDAEAEYRLGMMLLQQNNNSAFPHLQRAADCGNANAQFRLAAELLGTKEGISSRRDKTKGLEYLKKAADQRYADALDLQYQLNQPTTLPDHQKGKRKGRNSGLNFLYLAACIALILIGNYRLTDKVIIRNLKELQDGIAIKLQSGTKRDSSSLQSETPAQQDAALQPDTVAQPETTVQPESLPQSETVVQAETASQPEATVQSNTNERPNNAADNEQTASSTSSAEGATAETPSSSSASTGNTFNKSDYHLLDPLSEAANHGNVYGVFNLRRGDAVEAQASLWLESGRGSTVSSDESVAIIDEDGIIYAVGPGTCTVTVYGGIGSMSEEYTVNVTE